MKLCVVVFVYYNVGVWCLQVLFVCGVDVVLVVMYEDNLSENIWFGSVVFVVVEYGILVVMLVDLIDLVLCCVVVDVQFDFIFLFYYCYMLLVDLFVIVLCGVYNMYGLLLLKYWGWVLINWVVLNGEIEIGVMLYEMVVKLDVGVIIGQIVVLILLDDMVVQVFDKVMVVVEQMLWCVLFVLFVGEVLYLLNDFVIGSYYGGCKFEDGCVDWLKLVVQVYNLVCVVVFLYLGVFMDIDGVCFVIVCVCFVVFGSVVVVVVVDLLFGLYVSDNVLFGVCGDSCVLFIFEFWQQCDGSEIVVMFVEFVQFIYFFCYL